MCAILWDLLPHLEELSAATRSVLHLLAQLHGPGSAASVQSDGRLQDLLPRLFPFFRHTILAARQSSLHCLLSLLSAGGHAAELDVKEEAFLDAGMRHQAVKSEPPAATSAGIMTAGNVVKTESGINVGDTTAAGTSSQGPDAASNAASAAAAPLLLQWLPPLLNPLVRCLLHGLLVESDGRALQLGLSTLQALLAAADAESVVGVFANDGLLGAFVALFATQSGAKMDLHRLLPASTVRFS